MKKKISLLILLIIIGLSKAQGHSSRWKDLFSYQRVFKIFDNGKEIIGVSRNGIFYVNKSTGDIRKRSKAQDLHNVDITAAAYHLASNTLILGYKDGGLDLVRENKVTYLIDIQKNQNILGEKSINNIHIQGNRAVLALPFGVSILNIPRSEIEDSTLFGTGTDAISVTDVALYKNRVYALTKRGIYFHNIDLNFPVFNSWELYSGNYSQLDASEERIAYTSENQLFTGSIFPSNLVKTFINSDIKDLNVQTEGISITSSNFAYYLADDGSSTEFTQPNILTSIYIDKKLYIGTEDKGIMSENKYAIYPQGPYNNQATRIRLLGNQIWVATGQLDSGYNRPEYSLFGYYHFDGKQWNYPDFFKNAGNLCVTDVLPNPADPSEVWFTNVSFSDGSTSLKKGIYRVRDNQILRGYAQDDGGRYFFRSIGLGYDSQNNLFCSLGFAQRDAQGGISTGYYVYDAQADRFRYVLNSTNARTLYPTLWNKHLFLPIPEIESGGMIAYNYNGTPLNTQDDHFQMIDMRNKLHSNRVICSAVDKNNQLWVGTYRGISVFKNAEEISSNPQVAASSIIITQGNLAEELLKDAYILAIAVDSENNKWISVEGGGVYKVSPDGQQTLQRFDINNSPLPSNTVTDIQIHPQSGLVYFVTLKGIVSFQGDAPNAENNFTNVSVYPNPIRPNFQGEKVNLKGLIPGTIIRITDAAGNLVHQANSLGGTYEWNLRNYNNQLIASGIYFIFLSNNNGLEKTSLKLAVIR